MQPPKDVANDLLDVFSTNAAPSQAAGHDGGSSAVDPLADIFAQGSTPLAPTVDQIPQNDKYSVLNSFYGQGAPN